MFVNTDILRKGILMDKVSIQICLEIKIIFNTQNVNIFARYFCKV